MGQHTRKYSGPALDRYLRRFLAAEPGLPPAIAEQLAQRGSATFSSLRVRKAAVTALLKPAQALRAVAEAPAAPAPSPEPTATAEATAEFDAYAIGLVPTFQREGRDGLIAKLGTVSSVDSLLKMARAQQIVLPETMRQAGVAIDDLRIAIADAVAKRIADRRAAAG